MTAAAGADRVSVLVLVLGFLAATHALLPGGSPREELQYQVVIALGWGHLIGALPFRRLRGRAPAELLLGVVTAAVLFALYAAAVGTWPGIVLVALAVSTWHTFENEAALPRAYSSAMVPGPIPRHLAAHWLPLGASALVGAWSLESAGGAELLAVSQLPIPLAPIARGTCVFAGLAAQLPPRSPLRSLTGGMLVAAASAPASWTAGWLGLADLFVLVTLHHLLAWLFFAVRRAERLARQGRRQAARKLWIRLLLAHGLSLGVCAGLVLVPAPALDPARALVLAPGVYLFWSVLHVAQTALTRGLEAPHGPG
ncbi:MAG: hypothetical protein ABFS46_17085 [Myxococcota bacterium]